MNTKKVAIIITSIVLPTIVNAQQNKAIPSSIQPTNVGSVSDSIIKKSNSFEKEVTPLLREISKKRSQLELRKLDRDLEKIDEEALKSQVQLEALMNSANNKINGLDSSTVPPGGTTISPSQPVPSNTPQIGLSNPSEIKVLMIFGFDSNLYAKLASGQQGGYVVKKGDITPDGRTVVKITSNYIEVKDPEKPDSKSQRIFVSSINTPDSTMGQITPNGAGQNVIPPSPQGQGGAPLPSFPSLPSKL